MKNVPDSNQPLKTYLEKSKQAQGLIVVCGNFLLLCLLGQLYLCAFQLLGNAGNVLLVNVRRH